MANIITVAENNKKLAKLWLIQSVCALAISGFFAIFLVAARSPHVSKLLPYKDFFQTSLTIHVNLSVLIWLTSMVCTVFALRTKARKAGYIGFGLCLIGTLIVAGSIFDISAEAFLNNYIPMLHSKVFTSGIWIYFLGLFIASFQGFFTEKSPEDLKYHNFTSAGIILVSLLTLMITVYKLETPANKDLYSFPDYYERLFWGFGHMIQFLYTNVMIFAWFLIIFTFSKKHVSKKAQLFKNGIFVVNLILAITGIYIIILHDVTSFEYVDNYTEQMIYFGGVASVLAFFIIAQPMFKNYSETSSKPMRNCVIWSVILFGSGGIIALCIDGYNTIIPAHYHGSIIGVSVALMGVCYYTLPKLGYPEIRGRMANIQPVLYGSGQLLHIIGFAISGGYGALRKTPGVAESFEGKLYMGLMGLGGLISIIGGLFFVIIIFITLIKFRRNKNETTT